MKKRYAKKIQQGSCGVWKISVFLQKEKIG